MSTYLPTVFGENLFDVFDDFDRDFFRGFGRPEHVLYGKNASRLMKTDVKETDEGYEVDVDLPGFNKDEIKRLWELAEDPYYQIILMLIYNGCRISEFLDLKKESNRTANYFKSLGIKQGDRVMLVLKRHYQYWFAMMGLHKLGAVAIPATNQLLEKDFTYRFAAGNVKAILCTADGNVADAVDAAAKQCADACM